ncbi:DUF2400 domain-containing protein [Myxococcota bacterium]|nr:DUF2400 domain-containing protein [Myxococcota bacterium]
MTRTSGGPSPERERRRPAGDPDPGRFLGAVVDRFGTPEEVARDPLRFPRAFARGIDQEAAGLVASSFAFGRVAAFLPVLDEVFRRLGPSPGERMAGLEEREARRLAEGILYRWVRPEHLAALLLGTGRRLAVEGTLRGPVVRAWREGRGVTAGLRDLADGIRQAAGTLDPGFLLPRPERDSPWKRLHLCLRWMVRRDFPDLGLWREIPASDLVMPLDVHVHRLAMAMGLLPPRRSGPRLRDALDLTDRLRGLDPGDPLRFDFAWSHLGISGGCPGRRGPRCRGCSLEGSCRLKQA